MNFLFRDINMIISNNYIIEEIHLNRETYISESYCVC